MPQAVKLNVQDGNLGLQPGSNQQTVLCMGVCLGNNAGGGVPATLYNFGDPVTATNSLVGGELLELVQYVLKTAPGSLVQAMPLNPTTRGGVGAVTHTGPGAMTMTAALAPHGTITISCVTTGGSLGTAVFTFGVTNPITGVTVTSAPITSAASWSSTGFLIPGTYCTWVATAGTYVTTDVYSISTLGVITHPAGTGPAIGTQTSSPVDSYPTVLVTVTLGGALGTSQFTYSLDNGFATSAIITTTGGGTYAIPNTGVYLTFSGSATAGDTYTFQCAGPTFVSGDFTTANTALQSTYLNSFFASMIGVVGSVASAAAWGTQVAAGETQALAFNALNLYPRYFMGGPTVGTVLPNAGSITVDAADTDSTVITQRAGMAAPHVCPCAGDGFLVSPFTGLRFRRNAVWAAIARSARVVASQSIAAYADGGQTGWAALVRDDFANGLTFQLAGITSLQTFGSGSAIFINGGFMATVSTSDYYTLTNARVIDQGSVFAVSAAKQYIQAKIPTQTRNGIAGTIREDYAQRIESAVNTSVSSGLNIGTGIATANAVAAVCTVSRTNNIFSSGQLIINEAIQPFGYPSLVVVNIGLTLQAS